MSGYGQGYQGGREERYQEQGGEHHSGERGLFGSGSSHNRPSASGHGGGNVPLGGPSATMLEEERHKADQMHKLKMAGGIAAGALAVGAAAVVGTKLYNEHQEKEKHHKQQEQQGHQYQQQYQQQGYQQQGYQQPPPPQYQQQPGGGYLIPPCSGTKTERGGDYQPNPSRSSNNSVTPHAYPVIENNPGDNIIKFGTKLGLKHNMTGRLVTLEGQLLTNSGSNQLLAYAGPWSYTANCAWQVMPANGDAPPPGTNVNYGTEVRLLHIPTGYYLHSHHGFRSPKTGQQEVTGYGGRAAGNYSDENDHWVVERAFQGSNGWNADEVFLLKHKVTGCTLHSHNEMIGNERQEVTAFGAASDENDKWRAVLH